MKTAEQILTNILYPENGLDKYDIIIRNLVLRAMKEYAEQERENGFKSAFIAALSVYEQIDPKEKEIACQAFLYIYKQQNPLK